MIASRRHWDRSRSSQPGVGTPNTYAPDTSKSPIAPTLSSGWQVEGFRMTSGAREPADLAGRTPGAFLQTDRRPFDAGHPRCARAWRVLGRDRADGRRVHGRGHDGRAGGRAPARLPDLYRRYQHGRPEDLQSTGPRAISAGLERSVVRRPHREHAMKWGRSAECGRDCFRWNGGAQA